MEKESEKDGERKTHSIPSFYIVPLPTRLIHPERSEEKYKKNENIEQEE